MQELECFKCGFANNFGNKFCTNCGEKFQYSCPKCSSIIDPGVKFCGTCAVELDWGIPAQISEPETSLDTQNGQKRHEKESDLVSKNTEKPRRNVVPLVIVTVLLIVCIVAIFTMDIFLKY